MKKGMLIFLWVFLFSRLTAGERTGWGWGGVPALNFNADNGFGYGVLLNFFNYKDGGYEPYFLKINPIIFFTTGGMQDHTFFIDSPYLLGRGWRFNVRIRYKDENYYPFYGFGNDSQFDKNFIETDDDGNSLDLLHGKHYYTFQSTQLKGITNFQKALVTRENNKAKISLLMGYGFVNEKNDLNKNEGIETKVAEYLDDGRITQKEFEGHFNSYLKTGLIYDTRDNEPAPNSGTWSSILVEGYTKIVGSETQFVRLTLTDRRYFTLFKNMVYANRVLYEKITDGAPFTLYYPFGGSVNSDEGIGGYRTIRGQLKNRFIGDQKFMMNMELRYKFYEFSLLNQDFYLTVNGFYDFGRVWHDEDIEGGFKNFKDGKGLGLHVGWNENFIVFAEMAFGNEAGSQLYIDIGYIF
ncbi:MAG: BamA/TamA family outer membrane protein [Candidatus Marinimicrobia bacterium]|nr:BamA/TamA family outer membrane protein [Candidatus Neomarinimicrobiota bacterium]